MKRQLERGDVERWRERERERERESESERETTKVMDFMWPTSQSHFHLLFIFIEINFYSLSFLCDVCNKVHEHMQWSRELWWDHNTLIAGLSTYVLNIPILGIFEKDIELSWKNSTIWSDSYDEYGWSCGHRCWDTKDR